MSHSTKKSEVLTEQDAFEVIEMAIDDLDLLTRAFQVISEVCQQEEQEQDDVESCTLLSPSFIIH